MTGPDACRGWSLYLAGARVYHTGVGRWLTEDPLLGNPGDPMSFNRYLYVNANPVDYSDPSGLATTAPKRPCKDTVPAPFKWLCAGVGGVIGGAVGGPGGVGVGANFGAGFVGAAAYDLAWVWWCPPPPSAPMPDIVKGLAYYPGKYDSLPVTQWPYWKQIPRVDPNDGGGGDGSW